MQRYGVHVSPPFGLILPHPGDYAGVTLRRQCEELQTLSGFRRMFLACGSFLWKCTVLYGFREI